MPNQREKSHKQLVTRAARDPSRAICKGWYDIPGFCEGFFDRCEDLALQAVPGYHNLARRAVQMAEANGDRHLVNDSYGVLAHAYIAGADFFFAGKVLDGVREEALGCCSRCRAHFLRREGDLLGELREPRESLAALAASVAESGNDLTRDARARIRFLEAIAYHYYGQRIRAIDEAGRTLLELSLKSPLGFFLDTLAFMAVYIRGGDQGHDRAALVHLERFRDRIEGLDGWMEVRTRMSWVKAHLYARLGDLRRSRQCVESAHRKHLTGGLPREVVGSALDYTQLRCRNAAPRDDDICAAGTVISRCLRERPDLAEGHRTGLEEMEKILERYPEDAFRELRTFRRTVVSPVPGRLGERIGDELFV